MAYYAWSRILYDRDSDTNRGIYIEAGETVDPKKLGYKGEDDPGFQALVEGGSVREAKYPKMPDNWNGSPLDFLQAQAAEAADSPEELLLTTGGSTFAPGLEEKLLGSGLEKPATTRGTTSGKE